MMFYGESFLTVDMCLVQTVFPAPNLGTKSQTAYQLQTHSFGFEETLKMWDRILFSHLTGGRLICVRFAAFPIDSCMAVGATGKSPS